jgi:hypothetical protein
VKSSLFGASAFSPTASPGWKSTLVWVAPGLFPPDLVVQVKALACELPAQHGLPLSRWSNRDLVQQIQHSGLVASVSGTHRVRIFIGDRREPWTSDWESSLQWPAWRFVVRFMVAFLVAAWGVVRQRTVGTKYKSSIFRKMGEIFVISP